MEEFKVPTLPPPAATSKTEKKSQDVSKDVTPSLAIPEKQEPSKSSSTEFPYKLPSWSAIPSDQETNYSFQVLKSGQIIEEVSDLQKQAVWIFGRLPESDIVMAHPTVSRFHAVLQYRPAREDTTTDEGPPEGWYIYDLESTHGTFLNKLRIPPRAYIRIRVGHMLRLGASTRSYILQGPIEDEEPESELSVTELREKRLKLQEDERERQRNEGIDWGMGEDAEEETDLTHNPYASTNNEELFLDDPKKTLRGYFEREDIPLEYKCDEMSVGCFVCRVELPIDDANGRPIVAEVVHKGRKKECVVQCALEACRILDRHGVLRQANQEPLKRKTQSKDSDSDDEFWDRTGDVERRKQRKSNSDANVSLTYDDLIKQEAELTAQLKQVETDITEYQLKEKKEKERKQAQDNADLDSFMEQLDEDASKLDKTEIRKLRLEHQRLKAEHLKLKRLIKIAKPYELPLVMDHSSTTNEKTNSSKKQLPMIGKRNQFSKFKVVKLPSTIVKESKTYASDEEEIEDDNDEEPEDKSKIQSTQEEQLNAAEPIPANHKTQNEDIKTSAITIEGPAIPFNDLQAAKPANISICEATEDEAIQKADSTCNTELKLQTEEPDSTTINSRSEDEESNAKKRHRQRPRQRNKRHEVDIDELDEHESSEKYAKWMPPPNQTGDGFTPLNEKYGY